MYLGLETESKYSSVRSEEFGDRERQKPSFKKKKENANTCTLKVLHDIDVRAPEDTNPPDEEYRRKFSQKMCQFKTDEPVILPLFKKLQEVLRNDPNISTEDVLRFLSFSDAEREHVESTTSKQCQCEEWYLHKAGFITASKCKKVFTRQEALEKNNAQNVTKLVEAIALAKARTHIYSKKQELEPQNARKCGLIH